MQAALLSGIVLVLVCGYRNIRGRLAEGSRTAVGGVILAAMNTASEYGFGAVIAALPGFLVLSKALAAIPNPLLNEAISVTVLAGITGSASGDEHRAGGDVRDLVAAAHAANIPPRSCTVSPPWPAAAWTPYRITGGDHPAGDHRPEPSPAYGVFSPSR